MNGRTNSTSTGDSAIVEIPLDPRVILDAIPGNGQVLLTWEDPKDKYATPEGEQMEDTDQLVSVWTNTVVVRKANSAPVNILDGTVITSSGSRDQYKTDPFVDDTVTNNTLYFYGLFGVNENGVPSEPAVVSVLPRIGTPASELPVGTIVKVNENGSPVEYTIIHQGKPNSNMYDETCNGTWLLRRSALGSSSWKDQEDRFENDYTESALHKYLNSTILARYSTWLQNNMITSNIPVDSMAYWDYTDDSRLSYTNSKIFVLSIHEVGYSSPSKSYPSGYVQDGVKLDYFGACDTTTAAGNIYIVETDIFKEKIESSGISGWTRSLKIEASISQGWPEKAYDIGIDDGNGKFIQMLQQNIGAYTSMCPAFIIPPDRFFDGYLNLVEDY